MIKKVVAKLINPQNAQIRANMDTSIPEGAFFLFMVLVLYNGVQYLIFL